MKVVMAHFRQIGGVSGGLERVLCNFSNELTKRGHEVHVVVYDDTGKKPYYPLDAQVRFWNLGEYKSEPKNMPIFKKISRELVRYQGEKKLEAWYERYRDPYIIPAVKEVISQINPDVIIVYYYTTSGSLYAANLGYPVVTMFHNVPNMLFNKMSDREMEGIRHSKLLQALIPSYAEEVKERFPEANVVCIPNIVPQYNEATNLRKNKERYQIINVARLNKISKRQHLLIEAFTKIAEQFPLWDLVIWGKGRVDYTKKLQRMISHHHLENRIFLKGVTDDIESEYKKADIFAFPSAFEGFPLAMTEAMSAGLPVVAYRSCPAVNEIVEDSKTGLLVEDGTDALAAGLRKLMEDQELRVQMGWNAHEAMKQYAPEKIWDQWEELLKQVVEER